MLDAFIIEKIRNERRSGDSARLPLHIEVPRPTPPEQVERPQDDQPDRGVVIIDFTI